MMAVVKLYFRNDSLDLLADRLNVSGAYLSARDQVVGPVFLVSGDEIRVVDARKRGQSSHLLPNLLLEGGLEDLGAVHGIREVQGADIPASNDDVIRVDHGEYVVERDIDVLRGFSISAKFHSGTHKNRAIVIRLLGAFTGFPSQATSVGNDSSSHGRAVITTPANKHDTQLRNRAVDFKVIDRFLGRGHILAIDILLDLSGAVSVLGVNLRVAVNDVRRVNSEELLQLSRGGRNVLGSVRGARVNLSVRGHCKVEIEGWRG